MKLTAKVSGFGGLATKLNRIVASVDGRKSGVVLEEAAEPILARMKQFAPVRTGGLRASLAIVVANDGLSVTIGPAGRAAWRAHFVELGTVNMPAAPFIRPAFDYEKGRTRSAVAKQLRSSILISARES